MIHANFTSRVILRAAAPLIAFITISSPVWAVPYSGLYFQPIPDTAGNIQAVAEDGVLQVDYVPTMSRLSGGGAMQFLQVAARLPVPLLDTATVGLRGLVGYRQQWAYYDNGAEDTYGGIDVGLSGALKLGALPYVGDYLKQLTVYGYGMQNRLITAKAQGTGFATGGLMLPNFGAGLGYQLQSQGLLYIGLETWSIPSEMGSGTASLSGGLKPFEGLVIGYRW